MILYQKYIMDNYRSKEIQMSGHNIFWCRNIKVLLLRIYKLCFDAKIVLIKYHIHPNIWIPYPFTVLVQKYINQWSTKEKHVLIYWLSSGI